MNAEMPELPRGRITNSDAFEVPDVINKSIERLISYCCSPTTEADIDVLLLKIVESAYWHRFFLDAGIGFWEELSDENVACGWDDLPMTDLATKWNLKGEVIVQAKCVGDFAEAKCSAFQFGFGEHRFIYRYATSNDMESQTVFERLQNAVC